MRIFQTAAAFVLPALLLQACHHPTPHAEPATETPPPAAEVSLPPFAEIESGATQIAGAVHASPPELRDAATVLGYTADGSVVTLRQGSNHLICLADRPGDERFQIACYQEALEPYMARGRELRSQGVTGPDSINRRHEEIEAGTLFMPSAPAAVYTLGGDLEIFDPATGEISGGRSIYALYTPYETEVSTGLSTTPASPGAPWIMRPGTPTSHIMVTPPVPAPTTEADAG